MFTCYLLVVVRLRTKKQKAKTAESNTSSDLIKEITVAESDIDNLEKVCKPSIFMRILYLFNSVSYF